MMIKKLFLTVFNMSKTASIALLFVLLMRLALKKAPKIYSYVLWGVLIFRLLCPYSLPFNLSLYNIFPYVNTYNSQIQYSSGVVYSQKETEADYTMGALPAKSTADDLTAEEMLFFIPESDKPDYTLICSYIWLTGALYIRLDAF